MVPHFFILYCKPATVELMWRPNTIFYEKGTFLSVDGRHADDRMQQGRGREQQFRTAAAAQSERRLQALWMTQNS